MKFDSEKSYILLSHQERFDVKVDIYTGDELERLLCSVAALEDQLEEAIEGTAAFIAKPRTYLVREYIGGKADQDTFHRSPAVKTGAPSPTELLSALGF